MVGAHKDLKVEDRGQTEKPIVPPALYQVKGKNCLILEKGKQELATVMQTRHSAQLLTAFKPSQ